MKRKLCITIHQELIKKGYLKMIEEDLDCYLGCKSLKIDNSYHDRLYTYFKSPIMPTILIPETLKLLKELKDYINKYKPIRLKIHLSKKDTVHLSLDYKDNPKYQETKKLIKKAEEPIEKLSKKDKPEDIKVAIKLNYIFERAIKDQKEFSLSFKRLKFLTRLTKCQITGIEFVNTVNHPYSLSIDRLDNNIGYTDENSIACIKDINNKKSNLSIQDIEDIYNLVFSCCIIPSERIRIINILKQSELSIDEVILIHKLIQKRKK